MNAIKSTLTRALATLIVALPLASCSIPSSPPEPSVPESASTPTGVIEVLPTPTVAEALTPVTEATAIPATPVPPPDENWLQESYGDAWTIGYPADWVVNDAGAHEGALQLEGTYEGRSYSVTYSYPMGILVETLEAWVDEALLPLSMEQREAVVVSDLMVANTPAKKALNVPTPDGLAFAHHVYIWRSENRNPRLITITQSDGQPVDPVAMDQLLDRLLVSVQ